MFVFVYIFGDTCFFLFVFSPSGLPFGCYFWVPLIFQTHRAAVGLWDLIVRVEAVRSTLLYFLSALFLFPLPSPLWDFFFPCSESNENHGLLPSTSSLVTVEAIRAACPLSLPRRLAA
jgi:hypothetical protein